MSSPKSLGDTGGAQVIPLPEEVRVSSEPDRVPRTDHLGLVISENKVEIDPVKVAGVCEWPTPENQTDVQTFIGFVNFYRRFIWDFSTIARPLFDLTHSDKA